ncbi:hypothetical protein FGIG_11420 [Fasciola gigantica]|uniref:Uncharacterized protein n=1 Tax=Fasciola gigantica TaxID=46835 RepID=A0A504YTM2_FASGI|nr:hypothetical protein FGIG_11420 [Fasciola gigantica]
MPQSIKLNMEKLEINETTSSSPGQLPRYELEEQLRFYKTELDKKDELIREMTKLTAYVHDNETQRYITGNSGSSEKLDQIRSRVEKLQLTIAENKDIIQEKNCMINELRAENEAIKVDCLTHIQRIEELEHLLEENSRHLRQIKTAEEQYDTALRTLQNDVKAKNEKILQLQSQIRQTISEQKFEEDSKQLQTTTDSLRKSIEDFAALLDCESTPEQCILKLADLLRTHSVYKTQALQKADEVESFQFEQRAARETVLRLSGELNKEQQECQSARAHVQSLQAELQKLQCKNEQTETQNSLLQDRIKQLTEALQAAHRETEAVTKQFSLLAETESKIKPRPTLGNNIGSEKSSSTSSIAEDYSATFKNFL